MAEKVTWDYEKLDLETGKIKYAPTNDFDGKVTGHIVFGVKQWFDENPSERIRLGWVKHIHHSTKDIEYNRRTQYLVCSQKQVDEYTVEDEYHIMDKSEEMMRLEELIQHSEFFGDSDDIIWGGVGV